MLPINEEPPVGGVKNEDGLNSCICDDIIVARFHSKSTSGVALNVDVAQQDQV